MISIRRMSLDDVPVGMRLKEQARWNQTEADWRRFLRCQPDGCFVAELDGRATGTVVTCIFGQVAWIGMMLVEENSRGLGIGRALMNHALDWLSEQNVESVRLDATPMGQPLYEKLGFTAQFTLERYTGPVLHPIEPDPSFEYRYGVAERGQILSLDRTAVPYNRRRLLDALLDGDGNHGIVILSADRAIGYVLTRPGSLGTYIGPCIATTSDAGRVLLGNVLIRHTGSLVVLDLPTSNREAATVAESVGLQSTRQLVRMNRGRPVEERQDLLWTSSGPETG